MRHIFMRFLESFRKTKTQNTKQVKQKELPPPPTYNEPDYESSESLPMRPVEREYWEDSDGEENEPNRNAHRSERYTKPPERRRSLGISLRRSDMTHLIPKIDDTIKPPVRRQSARVTVVKTTDIFITEKKPANLWDVGAKTTQEKRVRMVRK
jgi:hypothetical protein